MFLLMLLACWFAVRIVKRNSAVDQVGYVISAALAMWAHPFAAFALLAVNIYYVACYALGPEPATDFKRWLVLQFAFSLLFWPWLSRTWRVVQTGLPWIMESTSFPQAVLSYAGSVMLLALLAVVSLVAIGYGIAKRDRGVLLLVLLIALPVFGPLAFASRLYQTFIPRYGIMVVGALLLLAAYGITRLRPWAMVLVCVAYVTVALAHFHPGYGNYPGAEPKADIRSATAYVIQNAAPGDSVMTPEGVLFDLPLTHYLRGQDLRLLSRDQAPDRSPSSRLWVVYRAPQTRATVPGFVPADFYDFNGVVLYQFVPLPLPVRTTAPSGP